MAKTYEGMVGKLKSLESRGLSASIYTMPFDVEGEQNGLMTYDRAVIKIPLGVIQRINGEIIPKSGNYIETTQGFTAENTDLTPQAQRYAMLVTEYRNSSTSAQARF